MVAKNKGVVGKVTAATRLSYVMSLFGDLASTPGIEPLDRVARDWVVTIDKKRNRVTIANLYAGDVDALRAACDKLGFPWMTWEPEVEPTSVVLVENGFRLCDYCRHFTLAAMCAVRSQCVTGDTCPDFERKLKPLPQKTRRGRFARYVRKVIR